MARILIVEDETHIARVLGMWLTRHGHTVVHSTNGVKALQVLEMETVDLIISDMNMPELTGVGLAAAVREDRNLDVPFILLSARCDQDQLAKTLAPYNVKLYRKPFVPSRLVADIDELLGAART